MASAAACASAFASPPEHADAKACDTAVTTTSRVWSSLRESAVATAIDDEPPCSLKEKYMTQPMDQMTLCIAIIAKRT